MQSTDSLPGDQKAVLQLVLGRGRSYDQIARMLSINPTAVRERALAALDALGPQTRVPDERRSLIADYLLGQLAEDRVSEARDLLARSAPERAWARVVSAELEPLASGPLPEIPAGAAAAAPPPPAAQPAEAAPAWAGADESTAADEGAEDEDLTWGTPGAGEEAGRSGTGSGGGSAGAASRIAAAVGAGAAAAGADSDDGGGSRGRRGRRRRRGGGASDVAAGTEGPRSSRLGGGLLLILLAAAIIAVVLILVLRSGGSSPAHQAASAGHSSSATTPATTTATTSTSPASSTTTSGSSSAAKVIAQVNLAPPAGTAGSKVAGIAEVLNGGSSGNEIAIVAQNVPPNTTKPPNAYAVWLYNSPTSAHILGFVNPGVGSTGRLSTAGPLPSNAAQYKQVIVTLETNAQPKTPGKIILQGTLTGL